MKRLIKGLITLAVVAMPGTGLAYNITVTDNEAQHELHWETVEVPFTVHFRGAEDVHDVLLDGAMYRAFRTWGEVPNSAMRFQRVEQWVLAESEPQGDNVLYYTEGAWSHDPMVIGLTSINYLPDTGEIVDVDIEFNGAEFDWTVFDEDVNIDVQGIATHEIGHLVGLAHSEDNTSVMYFEYEPGELRQRDLTEDDAAGISYLYPCASKDCDEAFVPADNGCKADLAAAGTGGGIVVLALVLGLALWRRSVGSRVLLLAAGGLVAAVAGAPSPSANVVAFTDLEPLVTRADGVARGRVLAVEPYWNEERGHVHSTVHIQVTSWLRGDGPAVIELDRPSGALAEIATLVPSDPRFEVGQDLVLLTAVRDDGSTGIVGSSLGWIQVVEQDGDPADGAPVVRRHPAGPGLAEHAGGTETFPLRPLLSYLGSG
jgi:Matrixin